MPKKSNKNQNEKFAQDVLSEVNRLKQIAEQNVQANLAEMFSPSVKKMIAEAVMGEGDDFEEPSEEDLEDLEDALEEADYSDELEDGDEEDMDMDMEEKEKYNFESKGEDEDDFEDLEDLEEGDEAPEGDEEVASDDDFEELDEDFIRELESILEGDDDDEEEEFDFDDLDESDQGEMDEDQTGHSYSEKDPKPKMDEKEDIEDKMDEDATGHSYSEKDPKPAMDADPHNDSFIKENRQLKRMMRKVMRTLNEVTLDNDKTQELKNIFENYDVPEKAKVRVLSAIDKAKTKSEMFAISEAVKKQYKRKDSKRRVNESVRGSKKIGGNSKIKKIKKGTKGKNLKESINYDFANRLAEIANIDRK